MTDGKLTTATTVIITTTVGIMVIFITITTDIMIIIITAVAAKAIISELFQTFQMPFRLIYIRGDQLDVQKTKITYYGDKRYDWKSD